METIIVCDRIIHQGLFGLICPVRAGECGWVGDFVAGAESDLNFRRYSALRADHPTGSLVAARRLTGSPSGEHGRDFFEISDS